MKIKKTLFVAMLAIALAMLTGCGQSSIMDYSRIVLSMEVEEVELSGDSSVTVPIRISNQSGATIFADKDKETSLLAYHVLDMDGNTLNHDGIRSSLPVDVRPRESIEAALQINPADFQFEGDQFLVEVDLVIEDRLWYGDKGATTCRIIVHKREEAKPVTPMEAVSDDEFSGLSIRAESTEYSVSRGEILTVPLVIENNSPFEIPATEREGFTLLSYHIMDTEGNELVHDGLRTALPRDIGAGESVGMALRINTSVGFEGEQFLIDVDLVAEHLYWYSEKGMPVCRLSLSIQPLEIIGINEDYQNASVSAIEDENEEISMMWRILQKTVTNTSRQFRKPDSDTDQSYGGVSAGNNYPQFWTRDNNTALEATRFFADRQYLNGWIELHLNLQCEDGSIYDWVNESMTFDKNTVETDQETSLVQAACRYVALSGDWEWLSKDINGASILSRLDMALQYLLDHKLDTERGLLTGAHTIDWGDVEIGDQENAIYLDEESVITVDIYDQSMFVLAAKGLSELYRQRGDNDRADYWDTLAGDIAIKANDAFWLEDKGYYAVCRHVTDYTHDFDEDDLFAMGGNAMAILAGIADGQKAAAIFAAADERQRTYDISTVSGALLPPYPENTFTHPAISKAYSYQNGGQWDWFGARLILAMYQNGYYHMANEKLLEIADKVCVNNDVYEWEDEQGHPHGSGNYVGASGALAKAIIEGRYGMVLTSDNLTIEPHFDRSESNRALLIDSASGHRVGFTYRPTANGEAMEVYGDYRGRITVRLPIGETDGIQSVLSNDENVDWTVMENGEFRYAEIVVDGQDRVLIELNLNV